VLETLDSKVTLFELAKLAMRALIARPTKATRSYAVASGEATFALRTLAKIAVLAHRDRDASLASGARLARKSCWVDRGPDPLGEPVELRRLKAGRLRFNGFRRTQADAIWSREAFRVTVPRA